jgi:Ring finger domain
VESGNSVDVDCEMGICDRIVLGGDEGGTHLPHGPIDQDNDSIRIVIRTNRQQPPTDVPTTAGKDTRDNSTGIEAGTKNEVSAPPATACQLELVAGDQTVETRTQQGCPVQIASDESCAICMESYRVGETILWSSSKKVKCPHIFHKHCFVEYLASYRGSGTPCPMCRQDYFCEDIFLEAQGHNSSMTVTTQRSEISASSISSASENGDESLIMVEQ